MTVTNTVAGPAERELLLRLLSALLREDVVGLRSRSTALEHPDGAWLRLGTADGDALELPIREDGFQYETGARLPLLRRESDGVELSTADGILAALGALADPVDRDGYDALADECRQTLATLRLHAVTHHEVIAMLGARYGNDPADWTGLAGGLAHDTLAARLDHPVYPTARGRLGLKAPQLHAYAPEFHPDSPCAGSPFPRTRSPHGA